MIQAVKVDTGLCPILIPRMCQHRIINLKNLLKNQQKIQIFKNIKF